MTSAGWSTVGILKEIIRRTTLGTTSPKQDDKQISTSAADEQQETRVPVTGWEYSSERNMCYRFFKRDVDFDEARKWCKKENGDLTSIHSENHNNFLKDNFPKELGESPVWIGLQLGDGVNAGARPKSWTDGSAVTYENWGPDQPDNGSKDEYCTIVRFVFDVY
ncbi:lectin C-type domain protein [Ancylostoma ceylanicum]|uniref:Lectin C-type domain protein n=1 Tax=Ancylostoma ceylanicum TaxID=53326 RepID=A0A0D6LKV2_9BILA|nr:lectin C-type domain protein [Ancylostoma ceylanicum]